MGQVQHTLPVKPTGQRVGSRTCLRKGCERIFQPSRWNQRYCREADCLRQVHRWQAAKRQRVYRRSAANRQRHAEAERRRRVRSSTASQPEASVKLEEVATADGAWSRSNMNPADFCDRPGCYEPLPTGTRAPARYCGRDCRQALRRVLDRERKWLMRNRYARRRERPTAARKASLSPSQRQSMTPSGATGNAAGAVGDYRAGPQDGLSSSRFESQQPSQQAGSLAEDDHSETHPDRRSRPPPAD